MATGRPPEQHRITPDPEALKLVTPTKPLLPCRVTCSQVLGIRAWEGDNVATHKTVLEIPRLGNRPRGPPAGGT